MKNRINNYFLKKYEKDYYHLNNLENIIKLFKLNYFLIKNLYNFQIFI